MNDVHPLCWRPDSFVWSIEDVPNSQRAWANELPSTAPLNAPYGWFNSLYDAVLCVPEAQRLELAIAIKAAVQLGAGFQGIVELIVKAKQP